MALNQRLIDKQRVKQKYNTKIQVETDKMNRELEIKLRQQREHLQVIRLNKCMKCGCNKWRRLYKFLLLF